MATRVREATVTEAATLTLVKNMLRIATSSICYYREVFPEEAFTTRPGFGLNVHYIKSAAGASQLADTPQRKALEDARSLTSWLEQGVFDALQKKYLKSLSFIVGSRRSAVANPGSPGGRCADVVPLESWSFEFTYPSASGIAINGAQCDRTSLKKEAIRLIHRLIDVSATLSELPEEKWLSMKLTYNEEITPPSYEPKFFRAETDRRLYDMQLAGATGPDICIRVGSLRATKLDLQVLYEGIEDIDAFLQDVPLTTPDRVPAVPEDGGMAEPLIRAAKTAKEVPTSQSSVLDDDRFAKRVLHHLGLSKKPIIKHVARELNFPVNKVRGVFQALVDEGVLYKCPRKGRFTFIADLDRSKLLQHLSPLFVTPTTSKAQVTLDFGAMT